MAYEKISIHNRNLVARLKNIDDKNFISTREKNAMKDFLRLASIGKINMRKKISSVRLLKYLDLLVIPLLYFKKDMDKITVKEMEKFIQNLEEDKIMRKNKQPYADSTKVDVKRILMTYLKWRVKDPQRHEKLTGWIDCSLKRKTPEFLREEEAVKLFKACTTSKQRFIVTVLFDSGARAEEFLNIRSEDIIEPTQNFPYYRVNLKEEYSKTKGRTIGLYWKYSTEAFRDYLVEVRGINPDEPLIKDTYDAVRVFINRLGKKVLNKRVHLHLFRSSSATFYASKLNRQELCIRYGWRFTSDMPDVYIARAGLEEETVQDKMLSTNLEELEKENQELKTQFGLTKENNDNAIDKLKKDNQDQTKLLKRLNSIVQVMLKAASNDKKTEAYFKKQLGSVLAESELVG